MSASKIEDIPFSVLDLAPILHDKTAKDAFESSLSLGKKTDKLGYKRFWLAEHHNMAGIASSATSILIAYIASGTSKIRVGSGGIMLPNHSPLMVAEHFGTLETLYPGRIDLGLGRAPGTDQRTAMALNRDPMAVHEFPENVQQLQRYFSIENRTAAIRAIPGEGLDIPIWILGSSTDSAYLAASMGLPYAFASHFAPAHLLEALRIYKQNFKASKQLQQAYTIACVNVIVADTTAEAELLSTSFKKLFLGIITGKRQLLQEPDKDFKMGPMEEAALKQMAKYSFIGDKQKVKDELQDFLNISQVDELMISSHIYDQQAKERSYELLKEIQ